jgi:hypothetical protein
MGGASRIAANCLNVPTKTLNFQIILKLLVCPIKVDY